MITVDLQLHKIKIPKTKSALPRWDQKILPPRTCFLTGREINAHEIPKNSYGDFDARRLNTGCIAGRQCKILQKKRIRVLNIIKDVLGRYRMLPGYNRRNVCCASWCGNARQYYWARISGFIAVFFSLVYLIYLRCS